MSSRLVVRGLACRRGERILFHDFDLDVGNGEMVWLRAANGYGKTTLLRVLAGLAKAEAGTIEWIGDGAPSASSLAFVAHANALKDDLTVAESIRYLVRLHALAATDAAIAATIRDFGLHGRRHAAIRTLSQGQRRRVALMRLALSPARSTWLLDEPFDALDTAGVALVSGLLADHAARGGNVLFTSHVEPHFAGRAPRAVQLDAAETAAAAT